MSVLVSAAVTDCLGVVWKDKQKVYKLLSNRSEHTIVLVINDTFLKVHQLTLEFMSWPG